METIEFNATKIGLSLIETPPVEINEESLLEDILSSGKVDFSLLFGDQCFVFPVDYDLILLLKLYSYLEKCVEENCETFGHDTYLDQGTFLFGVKCESSVVNLKVAIEDFNGEKALFSNDYQLSDFINYWRVFMKSLKSIRK